MTTTEKKEGVIKASTTTTTSKEKTEDEDKKIKESDTNLIQNKYEVAVKLQDMQADPNSPLYSVKSFEELGLYPPIQFWSCVDVLDIQIFSRGFTP